MSLGAGIFLLVVGGILAFGIEDTYDAVNLDAIGYICMAAGGLTIILSLIVMYTHRRSSQTTVVQERRPGDPRV